MELALSQTPTPLPLPQDPISPGPPEPGLESLPTTTLRTRPQSSGTSGHKTSICILMKKRERERETQALIMNEITARVRFPFVRFLPLLPEPLLPCNIQASEGPCLEIMCHPSGSAPSCWSEAGPGSSAGSSSKGLMGFVTTTEALLIKAITTGHPDPEAGPTRIPWCPGLPTVYQDQPGLGRGPIDLHPPRPCTGGAARLLKRN